MSKVGLLPCAGVIVFSPDLSQTVLVETHHGRFSFPKGKRISGESYLHAALRELREETGLQAEDIEIEEGASVVDFSSRGNPSVHYLIAKTLRVQANFDFDPDELKSVSWFPIDRVASMEGLSDTRKNLVQQALHLCLGGASVSG